MWEWENAGFCDDDSISGKVRLSATPRKYYHNFTLTTYKLAHYAVFYSITRTWRLCSLPSAIIMPASEGKSKAKRDG